MTRGWLAALVYVALTALFTWPLPYFFFTHHVGESGGDARIYLWNLWWVRKALVDLHANPLRTDYIFYPVGIGLALHTLALLHGVLFVPLRKISCVKKLFQTNSPSRSVSACQVSGGCAPTVAP